MRVVRRVIDWVWMHPTVFIFAILAAAQVVGWWTLEHEASIRQERSCEIVLEARADSRRIWHDVIRDLGADSPRVQEAIDTVDRRFAELPAPVDCE